MKLVTLASGAGLRLKDYDHNKNLPKPLINILDKTLIEWSLYSYNPLITKGILKKSDLVFTVLEEHDKNYDMSNQLKVIFGNEIKIIIIKNITRGPAETALIASKYLDQNEKVIFNDCDHYFSSACLLNFLSSSDVNKYKAALLVTETNSKKPEWSYVKYDKNKNLIAIKEKDKKLAESGAKGIIACYYFQKLRNFTTECKKMIKERDLVGSKNVKEFFISKVYDRLLLKDNKIFVANSDFGIPMGTPDQIIKVLNSNILKSSHPEPPTYIFDIDGVLLEHDKGYHNKTGSFQYPAKGILNNINILKNLHSKGAYILIISARSENERKNIEKEFRRLSIPYNQLLLGISGGQRFLINDLKPSNPFKKTAIGIENIRNEKINSKYLKNDGPKIIEKLKGGSFAETILMKDKKYFVRKYVSKNLEYERGQQVLEGQINWLKIANLNQLPTPKILSEFSNINHYGYDMEFLKNSRLFSHKYSNNTNLNNTLFKNMILKPLFKFYDNNLLKSTKDNSFLTNTIKKKVIPSVNTLENFKKGSEILNLDEININGKIYPSLKKMLSVFLNNKTDKYINFLKQNFDSNIKTLIHGDLTLENIIISNKRYFFIDPLGAFMDFRSNGNFLHKTNVVFDLGKLSQSFYTNYEKWTNLEILNNPEKNYYNLPVSISKNNNLNFISNYFKNYLGSAPQIQIKLVLVTILCRIIRYKINLNQAAAVHCYLYATVILYDIINKR